MRPGINGAGDPVLSDDHLRPPLAILFNNQGLVKDEFRAGLALVRVTESSVSAIVYYKLGLFIAEVARTEVAGTAPQLGKVRADPARSSAAASADRTHLDQSGESDLRNPLR